MRYQNARDVLPAEVIEPIQTYIDGGCLYIPRKEQNRKQWGEETRSRQERMSRDEEIRKRYARGERTAELAQDYFLSEKSIQRIVRGARSKRRF